MPKIRCGFCHKVIHPDAPCFTDSDLDLSTGELVIRYFHPKCLDSFFEMLEANGSTFGEPFTF